MTSVPFQLGPYRCVKQLSTDPLADVFLAELAGEAGFVKQYTIKRFKETATALPGFMAGLTQDAQKNTSLGHGNIVRVVRMHKIDNSQVLVSEFVEGESLRSVLDRLKREKDQVPVPLTLHLGIELLRALDYAHSTDPPTAHGALSPNHIMLTSEGGVRVLNVGLAWSLARSRNLVGRDTTEEYAYLAPEQLESSKASPRADLFSLGVLLYEMLTGNALFQLAPGNRRRLIPSPMKALDGELDALKPIMKRLLIKDPSKRYTDAGEALEALQTLQFKQGESVSTRTLIVWLEEVLREAPAVVPPTALGAEMEFDDAETRVGTFEERTTSPEDLQPLASISQAVPDLSEEDDGFKEDDVTREIDGVVVRPSRPSALPLPPQPNTPLAKEISPESPEATSQPLHAPAEDDDATTIDMAAVLPKITVASTLEDKSDPEPAALPEPEPSAPTEPAPLATPEPKYAADKPPITRTEPIRIDPPKPKGASAGLKVFVVFITLLCLGALGAAAFLYLELEKLKKQGQGTKAAPAAGPTSDMEPPAMRRDAETPERPRPQDADGMGGDGMGADGMGADGMGADGMGADATTAAQPPPDGKIGPIVSVDREGKPKAYELELLTAPTGVAVIHGNRLLGVTPIRLRVKTSGRYLLVLNKEGLKVKVIKPKFSRFAGLRHRVTLKASTGLARKGADGQTRLDVRCRTPKIFRVFLNGRDTGRNCPVVLKVSRGPNAPGIFLPDKDRVSFKKVKSVPQQSLIVKFPN